MTMTVIACVLASCCVALATYAWQLRREVRRLDQAAYGEGGLYSEVSYWKWVAERVSPETCECGEPAVRLGWCRECDAVMKEMYGNER